MIRVDFQGHILLTCS